MNAFLVAGSAIAIVTYFPLWKQIHSRKVSQNLLTWILWGSVDFLIATQIIFEKGNFLLALTYAAGSLVTACFIYKAKNISEWTLFESFVVVLVFISMLIWYFSGAKIAIIASSTAVFISGIPQIIDAYKKPHEMPFLIYLSYMAANFFSIAGAKNWSVEERFYPVVTGILCFLILVCVSRKFLKKS